MVPSATPSLCVPWPRPLRGQGVGGQRVIPGAEENPSDQTRVLPRSGGQGRKKGPARLAPPAPKPRPRQTFFCRSTKDFAEMYPERFNNKTNGVTPRRWLLLANPELARLITDAIGDKWIADLDQLARLKPLAEDSTFREKFRLAKRKASERFSSWL